MTETIKVTGMSTETKYEYLIGMIEGCMIDDADIVDTETLLESLLVDLIAKYLVFSPTDSRVLFSPYPKDKRISEFLNAGGMEDRTNKAY